MRKPNKNNIKTLPHDFGGFFRSRCLFRFIFRNRDRSRHATGKGARAYYILFRPRWKRVPLCPTPHTADWLSSSTCKSTAFSFVYTRRCSHIFRRRHDERAIVSYTYESVARTASYTAYISYGMYRQCFSFRGNVDISRSVRITFINRNVFCLFLLIYNE